MPGTRGYAAYGRNRCFPGHTPAWAAARAWKATSSPEFKDITYGTVPVGEVAVRGGAVSMPPTAKSGRSKGSSSILATAT